MSNDADRSRRQVRLQASFERFKRVAEEAGRPCDESLDLFVGDPLEALGQNAAQAEADLQAIRRAQKEREAKAPAPRHPRLRVIRGGGEG